MGVREIRRPEPARPVSGATKPGGRSRCGQMTVEVAVALPVLIAVALIAVNTLTFVAYCAEFDRVACEAVRVYAASPAYGQGVDQDCALVSQAVQSQFDGRPVQVSVTHGTTGLDLDEYTATLEYSPTLFGRALRTEAFGVAAPRLVHEARYVVDRYRPGVIL